MIYLPSGQREKGQDLIEYALLLALLVAVGVLIYSQSGLKDSLQTIFRNSGNLMETAAQGSSNGENNQEHSGNCRPGHCGRNIDPELGAVPLFRNGCRQSGSRKSGHPFCPRRCLDHRAAGQQRRHHRLLCAHALLG